MTRRSGVTVNDVERDAEAPAEAVPDKSEMVDERSSAERLADIRAANADRVAALAAEIEKGKPVPLHPQVLMDQKFLLEQIDAINKELARYKKLAGE